MAKQKEKEQAILLRKSGKSIKEISNALSVSKSTASLWCRNISLSPTQIKRIAERSKHQAVEALLLSAEKQRIEREIRTRKMKSFGIQDVGKLQKRDLFMVGLGLYWGEGYKQGSQELGFTNSNPEIIKLYVKWLKEIYSIEKSMLILRVSINDSHKYRIKNVQKYWSELLNVPLTQFTKPSLIKVTSKKIYSNKENHYGTLRVKVRRGTDLRRRILGSISALN